MKADPHGPDEIEAMKSFAAVCPLGIVPDSIEKCSPPEPDIRCQTSAGEDLFFELTELVEPGFKRIEDDIKRLGKAIMGSYQALPPEQKEKFERRWGYSDVGFSFSDEADVTLRSKLSAIPEAYSWLMDQEPTKPWSEIDLDPPQPLKRVIFAIHIARGYPKMSFSLGLGTKLVFRAEESIKRKLEKKYTIERPLELLAFYGMLEPSPKKPDNWKPYQKVEAVCSESLPGSCFRRVWVFDLKSKTILFTFPKEEVSQ